MRQILGDTLHFESNVPESIEDEGIFVFVGVELDGGVWCARYSSIRPTSKAIFPRALRWKAWMTLYCGTAPVPTKFALLRMKNCRRHSKQNRLAIGLKGRWG